MCLAPSDHDVATVITDDRARIAIDLGAQSCRVSLLRWNDGIPEISLIHRMPNGPVHDGGSLRWPLEAIFAGLEVGLRKAAAIAPEGIASIAVDGWAVDYVRLGTNGLPLANPHCYRDERTVGAKKSADRIAPEEWLFRHTGVQPARINTVYQLLADRAAGVDSLIPWLNLPEYVLYRLGGRRVAEYTNATHTGLVDVATGNWSYELLQMVGLPHEACPPIVPAGTVIGHVSGPLSELPEYRETELMVPACHDTASAIAGIRASLESVAYICSGTWSLVGTTVREPITSSEAMSSGFTNLGAASGGFCLHANVNGMWLLQQCLEAWRRDGRPCVLEDLVANSAACRDFPGIVPVDAPSLLLGDNMPELLNEQLRVAGCAMIEDRRGNEPVFARVIFESLSTRYAAILRRLETVRNCKIKRVYVLGGGSRNEVLTRLTAERTGLSVEVGNAESSTVGNFALQLAASASQLDLHSIRSWARRLTTGLNQPQSSTSPCDRGLADGRVLRGVSDH